VAARIAGLGVSAIALVTLLSGCSLRDIGDAFDGFGWPKGGITPEAHRMYDLWIGSVVAALAVGVFVWGLIFWCIIRYRKRGDEMPPQTRYNVPLETVYTIAPFLIVTILFYYTAVVQTAVERIPRNPDVKVEVVAFKWNWSFRYLEQRGPDGQDVSTVGTTDRIPILVLPTDRSVLIYERSRDVAHSFWVPELLYKKDVYPGSIVNKFAIRIDREGSYVGRCAELCGTYHSMMNFEMRAVSPERYQRYLDLRKQGRSTSEALEELGMKGVAETTLPYQNDQNQRNVGNNRD
jgi:cytochrome c oxidase subunit 2